MKWNTKKAKAFSAVSDERERFGDHQIYGEVAGDFVSKGATHMGNRRTRVRPTIDLDGTGKQEGYLQVPHSTNRSAYGWIPVPITSVRQGEGPRILVMAGNHGDEYEGQIALTKLARELSVDLVTGQVIVLPAANFPATAAGTRVSPVDGGNLNRCFPGDPDGSPTEMIADYIENFLLPRVDYVVDLHSGGYSLLYSPCTLVRRTADQAEMESLLESVRVFGAPIAYITDGRQGGSDRTLAAAAERQGVKAVTAELGGAGMVSRHGLELAELGTRRLLRYYGVLADGGDLAGFDSRLMEVNGPSYFVYATTGGIFEPYFDIGDAVARGEVAGVIHTPGKPWDEPVEVTFGTSGTIVCRRAPAHTEAGDCVYQLATDYTR